MIRYEAIDGPYLRWLTEAREKVGERVWLLLARMRCDEADIVMWMKGVMPFRESSHYIRWRAAKEEAAKKDKYAPTFAPVVYVDGGLVEVDGDDDVDRDVTDPRTLFGGHRGTNPDGQIRKAE